MLKIIKLIASLKVTLVGMILLGLGSGLSYGNPVDTSVWVLVVPLAFLAFNLMAAIATNKRINQEPGLLVFHVCLLAVVILAGVGRLTHLDAHLELPFGTEFHTNAMMDVNAGIFHFGDLDSVKFIQGPYTVQYASGLRRGLTHSTVKVLMDSGEWQDKIVGDDRPLIINGYRFYTTYNKGFAPVLRWVPDEGEAQVGTINMPSYPLFDFKQDNEWVTPQGQTIKFWLQLDAGMTLDEAWVLDGSKAKGVLVVTDRDMRREIIPGQSVHIEGGTLHFDHLSTWMGYRVFYDPTIQWLFFVSIFGVFGLTHYFWRKINLQVWESHMDHAAEQGDTESDALTEEKMQNKKPIMSDNLQSNDRQDTDSDKSGQQANARKQA